MINLNHFEEYFNKADTYQQKVDNCCYLLWKVWRTKAKNFDLRFGTYASLMDIEEALDAVEEHIQEVLQGYKNQTEQKYHYFHYYLKTNFNPPKLADLPTFNELGWLNDKYPYLVSQHAPVKHSDALHTHCKAVAYELHAVSDIAKETMLKSFQSAKADLALLMADVFGVFEALVSYFTMMKHSRWSCAFKGTLGDKIAAIAINFPISAAHREVITLDALNVNFKYKPTEISRRL